MIAGEHHIHPPWVTVYTAYRVAPCLISQTLHCHNRVLFSVLSTLIWPNCVFSRSVHWQNRAESSMPPPFCIERIRSSLKKKKFSAVFYYDNRKRKWTLQKAEIWREWTRCHCKPYQYQRHALARNAELKRADDGTGVGCTRRFCQSNRAQNYQ